MASDVSRTISLPTPEHTAAFGRALAQHCQQGDCLALDGPLGAGKTTLVRALVAELGGDAQAVTSPTFTLLHHYHARFPIVHVDAYRLSGAGALAGLGFDELSEAGLGIVEWASLVPGALSPNYTWQVVLAHHGAGRTLTITPPDGRAAAWLHTWSYDQI
jgi:tRNA threonylcarbamoyl adenosine modification protein YjeE